ncbi:MAG: hypothetical protein EPO32_08005 [Anaerolineae bacterium]|nr:MAG: hypothetical protein EPO32_08005 [Anaerolineae bacterium]
MLTKQQRITLPLFAALLLFFAAPALAQSEDPGLRLKLHRDFGYGGFSGDIQGNFSLTVDGPADLVTVRYYIDETLLDESGDSPDFRVRFVTDDHAPGLHVLSAVGVLADGSELNSQTIQSYFLSKESADDMVFGIIGPIFAIVGVVVALSALAPLMMGKRRKAFKPGQYGMLGGAVCPKCARPFSLTFFGLKLGFARLEHCPHCGKWSLVRRARPEDLEAAERLMMSSDAAGAAEMGETEADRLRRMVDESRYDE